MKSATGNLGEGGGRFDTQQDSIAATEPRAGIFTGTTNPRHLRALNGLLRRPMPREHIDREAGCSNAPDLVAELRRRGLDVPCDRVPVIDRDGIEVQRGVYHLSASDRRRIYRWFATRRNSHG